MKFATISSPCNIGIIPVQVPVEMISPGLIDFPRSDK